MNSGVSVSKGVAAVNPNRVLAQSYVAVSCGADVTEDVLATITIPAGTMGANGAVRIISQWTHTNSANTKTLRVKWAGTAVNTFAITTQAGTYLLTVVANRGVTNSQVAPAQNINIYGSTTNAVFTAAVDTTAAVTVTITGQKASAGETLTLEGYTVELLVP